MQYRRVLSRRTMLRGAGGIAIGLPYLDAMQRNSVWGSGDEPPVRAFNVFFGQGFPPELQAEGFAGAMVPLAHLQQELAVLRGVNQRSCDTGGSEHFDGSAGAFNGMPRPGGSEVQAGGPTLDQVVRELAYPQGLPSGVLGTLMVGTYFRRGNEPIRYNHCYGLNGAPVSQTVERPRQLFDTLFGSAENTGQRSDPGQVGAPRLRRSVLDSVREQYRHYTSDASNLGASSKEAIRNHLDRIREHELRVFGGARDCGQQERPEASTIPHGAEADPGLAGDGVDIAVDELCGHWRTMVDLFVLGVQCDAVRFGGLTFQSSGDRIRVTGDYTFDDQVVYTFVPEPGGGVNATSHEYWHAGGYSANADKRRWHLHLMMREIAYLLDSLNSQASVDGNGQSILHNSLVSISTELGGAPHGSGDLDHIFHAFSAACGRLRTGDISDVTADGLDVYNTIVREGFGYSYAMGPADRTPQIVPELLPT